MGLFDDLLRPAGQLEPGNVDLFGQPSVPNPEVGGRSTVYSFGVNLDGREYLLPRVTPEGRFLSEDEAIAEFRRTGRHLGAFDSPESATQFAGRLHDDYAAGKYERPRLGLFDDLLQPADDWRRHALPSEGPRFEEEFPDLPGEDSGSRVGAFARLAGSEAISGIPRFAGLVDDATEWLGRGAGEAPESLGDHARAALRANPISQGLLAGKAIRDRTGITGAIDETNQAIDELQATERETLRRGAETPLGSVASEYGGLAAGMIADPLNWLGTETLTRGGKALTEALPEAVSPLKRFLLQDLVGGGGRAAAPGAAAAVDDVAPAVAEAAPDTAAGFRVGRGRDLPPEHAAVEDRFARWIEEDPERALQAYAALPESRGGTVINTDIARDLSPDYNASKEARSQLSRAVHEPASSLAKHAWRRLLETPPPAGKDPSILFTAGGTGAGKTTGVSLMGDAAERFQGVYDGNLSSIDSATSKIDEALAAGKDVTVLYTHRDPVEAFVNGAIPRAMRQGRMVPIPAHADTHIGAPETFTALRKAYAGDERVTFQAVDNSLGKGNARFVDPAWVDGVRYDRGQLEKALGEAADSALAAGDASPAVHRGAVDGLRAPEAPGGAGGPGGREGAEQRARGLRPALLDEPAALPDDAPEIAGRESIAYLSDGTPVKTRWVLRDADTVETSHTDAFSPNPRYPHATGAQPRDLARPAEQQKIHQIRGDYNPDLIGPSNFLSDGAGTFARQTTGRPFLLVGNSRTMAQRQALEDPEALGKQLEALARQNREFGFPDDFLEQARAAGMRKPAAFREVLGDFDPAHLGREGNVATIGSLSDVDVAAADARRLTPELLDLVVDGAPLDSAANRDFVRSYLGTVVPERELGPLVGPHGELATSGERRIQNALLSAAYKDPDAVSRLIEADADGIRNVGRGMAASAARFAKMSARAERGELHARDLGQDVALAARKLADLRARRMPVEMYLRQTGMFGHELTPEARELLRAFHENGRDRSAVAGILRRYADLVESFGDPRQGSLLGGAADIPSKGEILDEAIRTWKVSEEPLLFPGGATGLVSSLADVLPPPLAAALRHSDPEKIAATARRWLSNFGDVDALGKIAPEVAERVRLSAADRAAHEARATAALRDYDVALKGFQRELSEAGIHRSEDEISQEVLDGILGESDMAGLSPALREVAGRMRAHVDELTGGILQDQPLSKELRYTLEQNLGSYLRRTYEIHRDPAAWKKVVQEQEPWRWEGAKAWVGEQHPQWTDDQIEGYLNGFFAKQPEAATTIAPRSAVFRLDKGLFKHRIRQHVVHIEGEAARTYATKEAANKAAEAIRLAGKKATVTEQEGLPKALEDFLGLHTDPRTRYAESVARMAHDLSNARLLGDVRRLGEQSIFFPGPTGEFAAKIGGDPRFNPLAGLYTTPEVRAVLDAMGRATDAPVWLRKVMAANATVRAGKTVGSPLTHVRNFLSWNFMLLSNGHFSSMVNVPRLWRASKVVGASKLSMQGRVHRGIEALADALETVGGEKLSSVFRFDLPSLRREYERGVRLGIIGEGRGEELARWLGLIEETKTAGALGKTKVGKGAGWVSGKARELYAGEDDVGKMVAWLGERANLQFAFPELSADQIAEMSAPLVRDLYPTYSKAPPAVRAVRDLPFFGDFPTFWAEIIRTSKNTLKRGAWELAQAKTNPRLAMIGAKRLAGFGTALAAVAGAGAALRGQLGLTSEEIEAAREFAPEWNRNADLLPVEKKGPGEYSMIDGSYINPYAMFREAWNALTTNGYRWDERLEGMFEELSAPFTNESIVTGVAIDLARNRDAYGRKIWPEFGTRAEKVSAMSKHAADRLQPGAVSQAQDVWAGATGGENPRTGRKVDIETLAWSWLTGTRQLEIDVPKRLSGSVRGLQRTRSEIVGEWNRQKVRAGSPTDLLERKIAANEQWKRALEEHRRKIDAARKTGLSDYQIRKILSDAEIGKPTIDALMGGYDFEVAR